MTSAPAIATRRPRRARRPGWKAALAVGVAGVVGLGAVVARDIARIDPTSGGYEAPYTDFSGEPIDWMAQTRTATGFRDNGGILLDTSLDCTSGMIRVHVGPFGFDYRTLSERAIAVHQPQVACRAQGFEPTWDEPGAGTGSRGRP